MGGGAACTTNFSSTATAPAPAFAPAFAPVATFDSAGLPAAAPEAAAPPPALPSAARLGLSGTLSRERGVWPPLAATGAAGDSSGLRGGVEVVGESSAMVVDVFRSLPPDFFLSSGFASGFFASAPRGDAFVRGDAFFFFAWASPRLELSPFLLATLRSDGRSLPLPRWLSFALSLATLSVSSFGAIGDALPRVFFSQ